MPLDLTDSEDKELEALLDQVMGDTSVEIADTDNPEFRRKLEARRVLLRAVRSKLDIPKDWMVDEQGRESFPASDPPAH